MKIKFLITIFLFFLFFNKNQALAVEKKMTQDQYNKSCRWGIFNLPRCYGVKVVGKDGEITPFAKDAMKYEEIDKRSSKELSFYAGTFDVIDKEGDDQTNLFGIEHRNPKLSKDTIIGKLSPISGGFMTGKSSMYLYTGVEANYNIGPLKIKPSFTPGYYDAGDGKDLGQALEFKSEIKLDFNIFENSKIGYSYSHISNNDWGDTNPGTDNQSINFSQKF